MPPILGAATRCMTSRFESADKRVASLKIMNQSETQQ
jgi:hypothetical protein